MAVDLPGFDRSWPVGATDFSSPVTINSVVCPNGYQYLFVKFSAGLLVPVTAATDKAVGIVQNKPAAGGYAQLRISGISRVRSADSGITVGSPVYLDAFGFVTRTQTGSSGCVGVAEEVSTSGGGYMISITMKPLGAVI
jgi:hypothetical protein